MMLKRIILLLLPLVFIFSSCASTSTSVKKGSAPAWVNDVYSVFKKEQYVAATGFGKNRAQAEANAIAALTSFFGQTVEVEKEAASSFQQAVVNGVMDSWLDTASMRTNVKTTASFENIMGVEIKEVWFDSKDTYYAAAVMEKATGIKIYKELLDANNNAIANLMKEGGKDSNSLQSVMCLYFAETLAKINEFYRNIIWLLGGETNDKILGPLYYRTEAMKIIKANPISVRISNDRNGRLFSAFASSFADYGFETSPSASARSRYALEVEVVLSPVSLPANPNVFSRIELTANLKDTKLNQFLIPFSFVSREGHTSQAEADNRCILAAERNINETFAGLLSDYLKQLRPKK